MTRTDGDLVTAALQGDQDAFASIVRRYQKLVFNVIYHYFGYLNEAEDLAQEVFLKVFRSLDRYDTNRPLQAWITRITVNHCLDESRKARRRRVVPFSSLTQEDEQRVEYYFEKARHGTALSPTEDAESFRLLQKLMASLSEKDRMALVLREFEGLSYAEVARALATSETAARIRVSRVKQRLLEELRKVFATTRGKKP